MQRVLRKTALLLAVLVVVAAAVVAAYFGILKPARAAPPDVRVAMTPERIARGRYLYTLADCDGCHSPRDFTRFAAPVVDSARGSGFVFPPDMGFPGVVVGSNITPDPETGLGHWTDGEKIRAIRDGIGRDGRALFPLMPYPALRQMSDQDVESLVAYLNTLPPIRNPLPRTRLDFPASILIRTEPRPAGAVPHPDTKDPVAYGRYLATLGGCAQCHTPGQHGRMDQEMLFAGGLEFRMNGAVVVSSNITPCPKSGIGQWTEEDFIARFHDYRPYLEGKSPPVGPEGFTLMPWLNLARLPAEDLKAMYAYLRTQQPILNRVEVRPAR
jgi:mono/diheme cytochrome c family protein